MRNNYNKEKLENSNNVKLTLIVVTHNVEEVIENALRSLSEQTYKNFELVVVDNDSKDETVKIVRSFSKEFSDFRLILNSKNIGTCAARNQGIEISDSKYIMTLDSDVILERNFLYEMMDFVKYLPPDFGMVGGKIMQGNARNKIDSIGLQISKTIRFYDIGYGEYDNGQYDKEAEIFGPCAAAALYKREMLEEIKDETGYFDSNLFYLIEDFDVALRGRDKGWKGFYCPKAVCYHKRNGSGKSKSFRQALSFRNRYYFLFKNNSYLKLDKNFCFLFLYDLFRFPLLLLSNPYTLKYIRDLYQLLTQKDKNPLSIL